MLHKPLIVVKVGTAAITNKSGNIETDILEELVRQITELQKNYRIVLVSSGAVGCGKNALPHYSKKICEQKAAAAIGNPLLMRQYQRIFDKYGNTTVAQALCEKHHFTNRTSFLQLWETFQSLWKIGAIPIANENDVVCDYEIRFSDNDELATMIACGFNAHQLLLGTAIEGVLNGKGKVITEINDFQNTSLEAITNEISKQGRGGMNTKIQCAKKSCDMGCETIIFDVRKKENLLLAHQHKSGTYCRAKSCSLSAHKRWIGMSGKITGKAVIDEGAEKALNNHKSLLLVGVKTVSGEFKKGDLLGVYDSTGNRLVATGRANISKEDIKKITSFKDQELIKTDALVLRV